MQQRSSNIMQSVEMCFDLKKKKKKEGVIDR